MNRQADVLTSRRDRQRDIEKYRQRDIEKYKGKLKALAL